MRNNFNLDQWFRRCYKVFFLFLAMVAIMLSGAEPFVLFGSRALWGTLILSEIILNLDQ